MNITIEQKNIIDNILMKYIGKLSKNKFEFLCRVYYDFVSRLKERCYIEIRSEMGVDSLLSNNDKLEIEEYFTKTILQNSQVFIEGYVTCLVLYDLDQDDTLVFNLSRFQINNGNLLH